MNRWQTIAVATGVVTLLSAGTALAVGAGQDGSPAADTRAGAAVAGPAVIVPAEDRETPTPSAKPTAMATATARAKISADQAANIALAKVGGGYVDEVERELEHGRWEWKVEVIRAGTEYDVRVDAQTGAITRLRVDDRDDRSDDRADDRRDDSDDRSDDNSGRGSHDDGDDDDHADDHGGDDDDNDDDNSGPGSHDDRDDD